METINTIDLINNIFEEVDLAVKGDIFYPSEVFEQDGKVYFSVYTNPIRRPDGNLSWKKKDIELDEEFFYD